MHGAEDRKQLVAKLLLVFASVLCILVAAEVALYFFPLGGVLYRLHPEHLFEHIPNSGKIFVHQPQNGGGWIRVQINSHGFHGPDFDVQASGPRVLVYGDSFIAGEYSPQESTFCARLGRELENRKIKAQVLNAGVVGYGPDQAVLRMPADLARYRPDLVVLAVFAGNDFGDLVRNKLFRIDATGGAVQAAPRHSLELLREFDLSGMRRFALGRMAARAGRSVPKRLDALMAWLGVSSRDNPARPMALDFYEHQLRINAHEFSQYVSLPMEVTTVFGDGYDADIALTPDAESARVKVTLMRGVLAEAARRVAQAGSRLMVIAIPAPYDLVEGYDGLVFDRQKYPQYDSARLTATVVGSARNLGLPAVDLYPAFASANPRSLFFVAGDDHWNDAGQRFAADVVAQAIDAQRLLDGR